MNNVIHTLGDLFLQLGLPNSPEAISAFVEKHRLHPSIALSEADFWTSTQAQFIRECWLDDSDWAGVVDQLDARLRT
jgi:hypothetical protein